MSVNACTLLLAVPVWWVFRGVGHPAVRSRLRLALVLTPIATTKSTVLGLRLDHDRRAWVEATAAEQGVSVRAVFEALIDRARAVELGDPDPFGTRDEDSGASASPTGVGVEGASEPAPKVPCAGFGFGAGPDAPTDLPGPRGPVPPTAASMLCVRQAVTLSGRVFGAAGSLVWSLVESNGRHARRCARDNWRIVSRALQ